MKCDNCGKNCDELLTRTGFCITFFVEWVCDDCFIKLDGKPFEEVRDVQIEKRVE